MTTNEAREHAERYRAAYEEQRKALERTLEQQMPRVIVREAKRDLEALLTAHTLAVMAQVHFEARTDPEDAAETLTRAVESGEVPEGRG